MLKQYALTLSLIFSFFVSTNMFAASQLYSYHSASTPEIVYCTDPTSLKCDDNGCDWSVTSQSYWFGLKHTSGDIKGQRFFFAGSLVSDASITCIYRANNGSEVDLSALSAMIPYLNNSAWNGGTCELNSVAANVRDCPLTFAYA